MEERQSLPLARQLADSVRGAVSDGNRCPDAPQLVAEALRMGLAAAGQGYGLRLFLLLDCIVLLTPGRAPPPYRAARPTGRGRPPSYEQWLQGFVDFARARLAPRTLPARRGRHRPQRADPLPLLLAAWGQPPQPHDEWGSPWDFRRAYRRLLTIDGVKEIVEHWRGPYVPAGDAPPPGGGAPAPGSPELQAAALRARFAGPGPDGGGRAGLLPERFDHRAAAHYLGARALPSDPHRKRRISELKRLSRNAFDEPQVATPEEYARFGPYALGAYLGDSDTVYHRIVNSEAPRLNQPPAARPPARLEIHLGWDWGTGTGRGAEADASLLNALAALILDDWREALQGLRVRFHLHRCWEPRGLCVSNRGGTRWQALIRDGQPPPAGPVVRVLFERADRLAGALRGPAPPRPERGAGGPHWRCGLVLQREMAELGIGVETGPGATTAPWSRDPGCPFAHLIAIDPPHQAGTLYRTLDCNGPRIRVAPLREAADPPVQPPDPDFLRLRADALELVLGVMEHQLRGG